MFIYFFQFFLSFYNSNGQIRIFDQILVNYKPFNMEDSDSYNIYMDNKNKYQNLKIL